MADIVKLKIAYLLSWNPKVLGGVENKIRTQVKYWRKEGAQVQVFVVTEKEADIKFLGDSVYPIYKKEHRNSAGKLISATAAFDKAIISIEKWGANIVYHRMSYPTLPIVRLAKKIPVVVEVNNDVLKEVKRNYKSSKVVKLFFSVYLKFFTNYLLNRASGVIYVTSELASKYNLKHIDNETVIPNSIDIETVTPLLDCTDESMLPRVAFLGSKENLHGLVRLNDLAMRTKGRLEFDVFGLNEPQNVSQNMKFHGFLSREAYRSILERCSAGLSTLCLYEKGLEEASSLKVREYLALGLPVIIAHKDTTIGGSGKSWLLEIANNSENVEKSSELIVDFVYKQKGRRVVNSEVEGMISSQSIESQRIEFMKNLLRDNVRINGK